MIWILNLEWFSESQDGLTGSAWGDWANYTASPLRAFESELGVQAEVPPRCKFFVLLILVFPVSRCLHLSQDSTSPMWLGKFEVLSFQTWLPCLTACNVWKLFGRILEDSSMESLSNIHKAQISSSCRNKRRAKEFTHWSAEACFCPYLWLVIVFLKIEPRLIGDIMNSLRGSL